MPIYRPMTAAAFKRALPDGGKGFLTRLPDYIQHGVRAEAQGRATASFYDRGWQRRAIADAVSALD